MGKSILNDLIDMSRYDPSVKCYNTVIKRYQNGEKTVIVYEKPVQYGMTRKNVSKRGYGENKNRSIYSSIHRSKTAIIDYSKANIWEYFITITFDKSKVDRYSYSEVSKKLTQTLNDIKKTKCPNLKYIVVPEQHKDGAWHFHGLFSNTEGLDLKKSGKRDKLQRPVYNVFNFRLGFTTATEVSDTQKVSGYITKYITKDLVEATFNKKRYWLSQNLDIPSIEKSKLSLKDRDLMMAHHTKKSKFSKTYSRVDDNTGEIIPRVSYFYQ